MKYMAALIAAFVLIASHPAQARHHHHHHRTVVNVQQVNWIACDDRFGCQGNRKAAYASVERVRYQTASYGDETIVSHPNGCPHVLFCGCGVSLKVYGHTVRDLYLVANWYRFPRAHPGPGMVAIFGRHHVAYIEAVDNNGNARLYDPNSGGHLTRVHVRNISGATVVNPNG